MAVKLFERDEDGNRVTREVTTEDDVKNISSEFAQTYEKIVIWAEESGSLSNNNAQYSFGNGSVGDIGIPIVEDWELYAISFNADISSNNSSIQIELMDNRSTPSIILTTRIENKGQTNNYWGIEKVSAKIPEGTVLGFRTDIETGNISDARVAAWLRRK